MPRRKKTDKFFIHPARKRGYYKNKRLLGINHLYKGDRESITVQDLLDFLKEQRLDVSTVMIPSTFITIAIV